MVSSSCAEPTAQSDLDGSWWGLGGGGEDMRRGGMAFFVLFLPVRSLGESCF